MILDARDWLIFEAKLSRAEVEAMTVNQLAFTMLRYNRFVRLKNEMATAQRG